MPRHVTIQLRFAPSNDHHLSSYYSTFVLHFKLCVPIINCYFTAKDIPEKLVDEVLRKVDVHCAKTLQLVPYMHRECIITIDEHQQLTNPQTTDLMRGNLLSRILMGKRVHWLLKFCHCLLQSYQSERGLDIHYVLLQRIKGECKYAVNLCASVNC